MYLRMLLVMAVTLYTSRVVLKVLGVDNFGIYNIVGGVVVLFTFINQAMAAATQRYFSYELGKKEGGDIRKIFTISLRIHIGIAIIVLISAETIGLWFLNNKMNFPEGTMESVNWVYQFSIIACMLNILRVPYNGLVISYERMSFFAINSVVESALKLGIVFLLMITPINKLVLYSFLILFVTAIITIWYIIFCKKNFEDVEYRSGKYRQETLEMIRFSGWATFGSVANIGYIQGVNILLNIGYGVVINAAVGIATQVNSAIAQFVGGFQQAINPQLIKSESGHNTVRQQSLIFSSAKFSFFIMLLIAIPIVVNMDYILNLWLGEYPPLAMQFSQLIILGALIECLSGPLWVTIFATGKIYAYQVVVSVVLLLNIPISFVLIKLGFPPTSVFLVRIILFVVALAVRLLFLKKLIGLNILEFFYKVVTPVMSVSIPLLLISFLWIQIIGHSSNFIELVCHSLSLFAMSIILTIVLGLSKDERRYISGIVLSKIKK